jgi:hypothetical protein
MQYALLTLGALLAAEPALGDGTPTTETLTTQIRAEGAHMPPSSSRWEARWVVFPEGCDYISHEIELLDEFPVLALSANRLIADSLQRDESGRAISMGISVGAFRPPEMAAGAASITVKLSLTVSRKTSALLTMRKKFATVDLIFDQKSQPNGIWAIAVMPRELGR